MGNCIGAYIPQLATAHAIRYLETISRLGLFPLRAKAEAEIGPPVVFHIHSEITVEGTTAQQVVPECPRVECGEVQVLSFGHSQPVTFSESIMQLPANAGHRTDGSTRREHDTFGAHLLAQVARYTEIIHAGFKICIYFQWRGLALLK